MLRFSSWKMCRRHTVVVSEGFAHDTCRLKIDHGCRKNKNQIKQRTDPSFVTLSFNAKLIRQDKIPDLIVTFRPRLQEVNPFTN